MDDLSIIIPVYNEAEEIEELLDNIFRTFEGAASRPEIIVVNDSSTDNTTDILRRREGIIVVTHKERGGYGASLKTGIKRAQREHICIIDADNTYSTDDILRIDEEERSSDMVVGDRRDDRKRPKDHLFAKKGVEGILSRVFGADVADLNSGLRVMKKDILLRYLDLLPDGFSFTSSITLIMLLKRYRIKYVPISYERREEGSKVRRLSFVLFFLRSYGRILWRYFIGAL